MTAFQPRVRIQAAGDGNWPPALFTRKSMRPPSSMVRAMSALT